MEKTEKRNGAGPEPQNTTHPERMPRPPPRPAPGFANVTSPSAAASREAPSGHPVFAHHERVSAAHSEFLRTQERVHLEFLAHRKRLLEWLEQAGAELPSSPNDRSPLPPP